MVNQILESERLKILVIVEDYPSKKSRALNYVHTRCSYYKQEGHVIDVFSFRTKEYYNFKSINVYSPKQLPIKKIKEYDIISFHAPNIRNHFLLIVRLLKHPGLIITAHGHEFLRTKLHYPKPYEYLKNRKFKYLTNFYDVFKLITWRMLFYLHSRKLNIIFVSDWMKEQFYDYFNVNTKFNKSAVISNPSAEVFEINNWDPSIYKKYDFITIRPNLDGSKYAIDLVCEFALANPDLDFLLVGKGKYFLFSRKPNNIELYSTFLDVEDIVKFYNLSRCLLLPTRLDSQGVSLTEAASFGIPVITSDIPIMREMIKDYKKALFIRNDCYYKRIEIRNLPFDLSDKSFSSFNYINTTALELELFLSLRSQTNGK